MTPILRWLLLASGLCLLALIGVLVPLLRAEARDKALRERVAETLGPRRRARAGAPTVLVRATVKAPREGAASQALRVLGYDEARAHHYPRRWWLLALLAAAPAWGVGFMASRFGGSVAWLLAVPAWLFACRMLLGQAASRSRDKLYRQFPDALAMVSRAVQVGVPVAEALRTVSRETLVPSRAEFARVCDRMAVGMTLPDALHEMAVRNNVAEYRFFATALALQSQTGGALSETLENLADTIRKRQAAKSRAHALASEARTSIYVLAALPVVVGVLLFLVNRAYISVLFTEDLGQKMLAGACFMLGLGIFAMRTIISRTLA